MRGGAPLVAGAVRFAVCGAPGDGGTALVERLRALGARDAPAENVGDAARPGARFRALLLGADGGAGGGLDARAVMAAAAASDACLLVAHAARGLSPEARRHALLAALVGVRRLVVAVDGMDEAGWAQAAFTRVEAEARAFAAALGDVEVAACVPVSSARGDNVGERSAATPWYAGPALLACLEREPARPQEPARGAPADVANQFEATVVWFDRVPLLPGRSYLFASGGGALASMVPATPPATVPATATVNPLKHRIDPRDLQRLAASKLGRDEIGVCNLQLDRAVSFSPFRDDPDAGGFVLVDRLSGATVGAGMLRFALRRASNVVWQTLDVNKAARAAIKGQRACVLWYTGLSGAGKSTIANLVDKQLHGLQRHTYLLDGDNVRHGLNKDLGFTDADRVENIRRIAEVAKLMVDAGLIVGTAFISPFRAERATARALLARGEFIEIFVDTPLAVAEGRDPKGLYKKARRGELKNFTGIDSPYEPPERPELRIDTTRSAPEEAAELVVTYLRERGMLGSQ